VRPGLALNAFAGFEELFRSGGKRRKEGREGKRTARPRNKFPVTALARMCEIGIACGAASVDQ